ncbi:MAG: DUF99 family protein [Methanomassiliicoccus sp.]|nr:DUF99 family protein [Methanomassiliicoccus sp.]
MSVKRHVRILGIDDSPFDFRSERALVVGVVARLPMYIEGIMRTEVQVDGSDANEAISAMVGRSRYREQLRLILFDGVAVGGFNVIDVDMMYRRTGIPCATVTREMPDFDKMEAALRAHFPDWQERLRIIKRNPLFKIGPRRRSLFASIAGMDAEALEMILGECTVQGRLPEPLRIAHLISSAMVRGESHGRA